MVNYSSIHPSRSISNSRATYDRSVRSAISYHQTNFTMLTSGSGREHSPMPLRGGLRAHADAHGREELTCGSMMSLRRRRRRRGEAKSTKLPSQEAFSEKSSSFTRRPERSFSPIQSSTLSWTRLASPGARLRASRECTIPMARSFSECACHSCCTEEEPEPQLTESCLGTPSA